MEVRDIGGAMGLTTVVLKKNSKGGKQQLSWIGESENLICGLKFVNKTASFY